MNNDEAQQRMSRIETALTHHQREYDILNSVVTAQAEIIDRMRRQLDRLAQRVELLQNSPGPSPRSLEDDRPPHY